MASRDIGWQAKMSFGEWKSWYYQFNYGVIVSDWKGDRGDGWIKFYNPKLKHFVFQAWRRNSKGMLFEIERYISPRAPEDVRELRYRFAMNDLLLAVQNSEPAWHPKGSLSTTL